VLQGDPRRDDLVNLADRRAVLVGHRAADPPQEMSANAARCSGCLRSSDDRSPPPQRAVAGLVVVANQSTAISRPVDLTESAPRYRPVTPRRSKPRTWTARRTPAHCDRGQIASQLQPSKYEPRTRQSVAGGVVMRAPYAS